MLKRVMFVLSAVALAGLVLFITLRAEPSGPLGPGRSTDPLKPLDDHPPAFDPTQGADRSRPVQAAKEYRFVRINNRGQLIQVFGKEFRPLPQGVTEVEWPGARVHLTPHRVIEIRARKGTFVAPDSQPRKGTFHGRVVLTLFESAAERRSPIDLTPGSPDVRLRLFMEDAQFDLELGTIESQSDVHLTSPRFDFRGTGLTMSYNEGRSRIGHMEIPQGKALRIKTNANMPATRSSAGRSKPASQPATTAASRPAAAPTYYVATFEKKVRVRGGEADIEGDHLRLIFSLAPGNGQDVLRGLSSGTDASPGLLPAPAQAGTGAAGLARLAAVRLWELIPGQAAAPAPIVKPATPAGPAATSPGTPQSADAPLPPDETMTPIGPDDINITWAGALTVEPIDNPPAEIRGPEDAVIKIDGQPVRITTPRKEVITASTLDYLSATGQIRLVGTRDWPVAIDSRDLGLLTCENLAIDQVNGTGQITGPGSLRGKEEAEVADAQSPPQRERPGLPRGMVVSWKKEVALTFFLRPGRVAGSASPSADFNRLRALRNVDFRGDVEVNHPQFDLAAQQLALALGDPEKGRQALDSINAKGQVRIAGKGEGEHAGVEVASEDLVIKLARDTHGSISPSALHARGAVKAKQAAQRLAANELDVTLGFAPAKGAGDAATKPAGERSQKFTVRTMQARQNVTIDMEEPAAHITADRVDADTAQNIIELHGGAGRPAKVLRDDGTLVGDTIVLSPTGQTVKVAGPGSFEFISTPPARVAAAATQKASTTQPDAPALFGAGVVNIVTVTWKEAMNFDNRNGTADFNGSVECRGRFGRETTRLTSEQLHLDFINENTPARAGLPAVAAATAPAPTNPLTRGTRSVRTVTAKQDVRFLANSWLDDEQKTLATRLSIDGPTVAFDNLTEQVQVVGPGHMLIEDYRPDAPTTQPNNPVGHFSGRGATLFTWAGRLTLDAYHNDLVIEQQVQMLHRPADGQPPVQVDCRRFTADLEGTGGLGVWLSRKSPQPTVKSILADQDVRVLTGGRTIRTDRLEYSGADQTVTLRAAPGHLSEVIDTDQPAPFTAEEFAWDLKTGHIVVKQPGAGRVPLGGK
ncbi:MAG: hypothetical protein NTW19_05705 [Planctomycetota bacterium]|nr:hypothetical protein [Planctomycetota bacterium]